MFDILDADFSKDSDIRVDVLVTELASNSDGKDDDIWIEISSVECHFN